MQVSMTVREVLQTDGLKDSVVLAGASGLDRKVTKITVAELPDTLDWIQGGELVCSTVYFLKDDPAALPDWIVGMAERNVAALAIKPERFIGKVPRKATDVADEYGFPLIQVPLRVTWPSIIEGVTNRLLDVQTERLSQSLQIHDKLTKLVLASKGIDVIVKTIAELVNNPIIFEDRSFNLLARAQPSHANKNEIIKARLCKEVIEKLKNHPHFRKNIIQRDKKPLRESIATNLGEIPQLVLPVIAGNDLFGWLTTLLVISDEKPLDLLALEHGSTVLALELIKQKASLEALARAKTDFLRTMLEDDDMSDHDLQKKANLLGIDLTLPTVVLIVSFNPTLSTHTYFQIEEMLQSADPNSVVINRMQDMVIFFHPKNHHQNDHINLQISSISKELMSLLETKSYKSHIGVSRCHHGVREIKKSYYEAKQALSATDRMRKPIIFFHELGLYRLLALVQDQSELMSFCQDTLGKLLEYDRKHNSSMIETLKIYLSTNCSNAEAARQLHLHINSLSYRLQRIEEITGLSLCDPETRTILYLSLRILEDASI